METFQLILFSAAICIGMGEAIELTFDIKEDTTIISCKPDDLSPGSILLIGIFEAGMEVPLATITNSNYLVQHNQSTNNALVRAEGHIGQNEQTCYLNVTLTSGNSANSGSYRCEVRYADSSGNIESASTTTNIRIQPVDTSVADRALEQVNERLDSVETKCNGTEKTLLDSINKLGVMVNNRQTEIHSLEQVDASFKLQINNAKGKIATLENTHLAELAKLQKVVEDRSISIHTNVSKCVNQNNNLEASLNKAKTRISHVEDVNTALQMRLGKAEQQIADLKQENKYLLKDVVNLKAFQISVNIKGLHAMCPDTSWGEYGNRCYKVFNDNQHQWVTWEEANNVCTAQRGQLVTISDQGIYYFVKNLLTSKNSYYWIGLSDRKTEGSYVWEDGKPLGRFERWARGQPRDNGRKNYDCVWMKGLDGNWRDARCHNTHNDHDNGYTAAFICQIRAVWKLL